MNFHLLARRASVARLLVARSLRAMLPSVTVERVWTPGREWRLSPYHNHPQNPVDRVERCIRGWVIGAGWWRIYIVFRKIAVRSVRVRGRRQESAYRCGWQLWKK